MQVQSYCRKVTLDGWLDARAAASSPRFASPALGPLTRITPVRTPGIRKTGDVGGRGCGPVRKGRCSRDRCAVARDGQPKLNAMLAAPRPGDVATNIVRDIVARACVAAKARGSARVEPQDLYATLARHRAESPATHGFCRRDVAAKDDRFDYLRHVDVGVARASRNKRGGRRRLRAECVGHAGRTRSP